MTMKQNKKQIFYRIFPALSIAGLSLLGAFLIHLFLNPVGLTMEVANLETIHIEYGEDVALPELNATYHGLFTDRFGKEIPAQIEGSYDLSAIGTYEITYKANYNGESCETTATVVVEDTKAPVITLKGEAETIVSPAAEYVEEGFTALDAYDGDLSSKVVCEVSRDLITYTVTDSAGNTAKVERRIIYKDTVAPVITLSGEAEMVHGVNIAFTEPGFSASDDCDGDITANVTVSGSVDIANYGIYTLTYTVTDTAGNSTSVTRTVTISDPVPPVITLANNGITYVQLGTSYTEPGFSASDNRDGDITSKVSVSGSVDANTKGEYSLTYTVTDSTGNTASVTRKIYVYEPQPANTVVDPGDKVIYLTFDDGPCAYTERLLNILDKYGVKVTFFVTGQSLAHQDMIGEAYRRGHGIGLHTFSHRFQDIYASVDAYYADLERIQSIVVAQTGKRATLLRFPGGASNTVSKKYCKGIMSVLAKDVEYRGYRYCDWNVSSGDAGSSYTYSSIVSEVKKGCSGKKISWVLQHDLNKTSVEATEEIIVWGLANGYKFLAMDETSPVTHHNVRN